MNFEVRKRKSWADETGVSEVVGNILILMITVILFSTIIAYVNQMPVPEQETKADFTASITFSANGTSADLRVTHMGGVSLLARDVLVLIQVDDVNFPYNLGADANFTNEKWSMGVAWLKHLTNVRTTSIITVTIIDLAKKTSVWTSQVTGGSGGSPPNILQRYVDSNTLTPSADYVKEHDNFRLYVTIEDPDNDLDFSNVWIDSSQIEGAVVGGHRPYDGVVGSEFYWDFIVRVGNVTYFNSSALDGAVIFIHAGDLADHEAISTFIMTVVELPTDLAITNNTIEVNQEVGESGLPSYITWISGDQGFGIYGENITDGIPTGRADVNDARVIFWKDEMVFIRVASLTMSNIFAENRMAVIDTRTGLEYAPPGGTGIFAPYPTGSGAWVYEAKFNTSSLPPGSYTFAIYLRSQPNAGDAESVFQTKQVITINEDGSAITFIPTLKTYSNDQYTTLWGTKDNPYVISSTTYKIYIEVNVLDAQTTPPYPVVEEVRIVDMKGGSQLYGVPPAGGVITVMTQGTYNTYRFSVDLRFNNGDQWLGGTNSYTLYISRFSDLNEGVYSLSCQVFIRSTLTRSDFFVGTTGMYSSQGGSQNFVTPEYLYYIENNNFFTKRAMYVYPNAPSTTPDYTVTALALGDLDGDGDKDVLMGQRESGAILYFENTLNTYGVWQGASSIVRPAIDGTTVVEWFAIGDTNGDGDMDFAYSSSGNRIVIYNNTYGMNPVVYKSYTTDIRKIDLKDMNGDGRADLIALVGGKIFIYDLKLWGKGWDQIAKLPDSNSSYIAGFGIRDFDIEDVNYDGKLDILTVGDAGNIVSSTDVRGVWINYYTTNQAPTIKLLNAGATGYGPVPRVAAGTAVLGDVTSTQAEDSSWLRVRENTTGDGIIGAVNFTMQFDTLTNALDQELRIVARISGGDGSEVFYAWYSTDSDGVTGKYIPMFPIASTTAHTYSFKLPSTVAGKAIYLRFTDSLTTLGSTQDYIEIDYVAVYTNTYGNYVSAGSRTQVVTNIANYICVRGANIDGQSDGYMEVVVAKNGEWKVYDNSTAKAGWGATGATTFWVECSDKTDGAPFASISPTLFDAVDVNGDGYSDVLVANHTVDDDYVSKVGVYINLNPSNWYYVIKDLFAGIMDPRGSATLIIATNVFQTQT